MIPNVVQQVTLKYGPLFWVTEPSHCEHLCWNPMETLYYQMINDILIIEIAGPE